MTDALTGTCGVCLRPIQLRGDHPIRHGFSAVGVRHGQTGGYHTGPCQGSGFPHLGISPEGTRWALEDVQKRLIEIDRQLAHLHSHPDLIWYHTLYNVRGRPPDLAHPVTLSYGVEPPYEDSRRGVPTYATEHKRRVATLDNIKHQLEQARKRYELVLANWSPEKYATSGTAKKVEVVHMEHPTTFKGSFGPVAGVRALCVTSRSSRFQKRTLTTDPSKVTCKKCRAALGLPPL